MLPCLNHFFLGQAALSANTTGARNTAVGQSALNANTEADSNTAVGRSALGQNTTLLSLDCSNYQLPEDLSYFVIGIETELSLHKILKGFRNYLNYKKKQWIF